MIRCCEWCVASSDCGLAMLSGGSLDGLERLAAGQAAACGIHILDHETGTYNVPAIERTLSGHDVVAVEWAWREQGLWSPLAIRRASLPSKIWRHIIQGWRSARQGRALAS